MWQRQRGQRQRQRRGQQREQQRGTGSRADKNRQQRDQTKQNTEATERKRGTEIQVVVLLWRCEGQGMRQKVEKSDAGLRDEEQARGTDEARSRGSLKKRLAWSGMDAHASEQ
jgi:hypothetical protein